ncbi:MAG: hypothetical protein Q8Q14_09180 [Gemmatimonadales bacterium]|nr:hypothetical protein [Gemmatimonadales bacterium]
MAKRFLPLLIGEEAPPLRPPGEDTIRRSARRNRGRANPLRGEELRDVASVADELRYYPQASTAERRAVLARMPKGDAAFIVKNLRHDPRGEHRPLSAAMLARVKADREWLFKHNDPPKTPLRGGKRGKRGGTVKPTGKFEHLRVRSPRAFVKNSLKTVPWIFVDARERAFVQKKLGLRAIPSGTKVVTGHLKDSVTRDRVPGTKVKWLASGVQTVLVPITGRKTPKSPPGTRTLPKRAARKVAARARRKNPGRLAILANPGGVPAVVAEAAKAMGGARGERFLRYYASLKPPDRQRLVKALKLFKKRHGVPCVEFELRKESGPRPVMAVGVGKALAVEYHANKGYRGSSKRGTPFRHTFQNGQELVTDENGRQLHVADRRGAARKTITTDWIYH